MEKRYVIGIDVGTTTIKAVFVDSKENKIATTQITEIFPVPGEKKEYIEFDAYDWVRCIKKILNKGFETGIRPEEVAGINIEDFTVVAFLVDKDGKPLHHPVHYNDMRHLCVLDEVEEKVGKLCVERNANYISMYNGLPKQYWWFKYRKDVYDHAAYFMSGATWINYLLTGKWAMNRPTAGFYGQYNAQTGEWDAEILEKLGMDIAKFPPLVNAWDVVGEVTEEAAEEFCLVPGIKVFGGMDDASPVALTCGALEDGDCFVSAGSAANVVILSSNILSHPTALSYPHCTPGLFMSDAVLTSTGLSYKWVRNHLGQYEQITAELSGDDVYDILSREAATSPPGANGVIFLPYLDGDYTPNNDPNARGCFVGLSTTSTKADMVRAVLEGVGFSIMSSLKMIRELGGNPKGLAISGGVSKSPFWMQVIADITGLNVSIPNEAEGAPLGSALIAGVGCGLFKDYRDAVERVVVIDRDKYIANSKNHELYSDLFKIYDGLYSHLSEPFDELAKYREKYLNS